MPELHILNGDCAQKLWEQCGFTAPCIVWRETYLEGPLPDTEDLHLFRKTRAEFLVKLAGVSKERLYLFLRSLENAVFELPERSSLMLWFDGCIFDQTLLMRILYLVSLRKNGFPQIFLYCCDSNCLELEDFRKGFSQKLLLNPQDHATAAQAWRLFLRKDGPGMIELAEKGDFERMPHMKKALKRLVEELPDGDNLTRTQRQILQILSEKSASFMEIFKGLDAFEEFPFLGDTACQRHLDFLVEKGLLEEISQGHYRTV